MTNEQYDILNAKMDRLLALLDGSSRPNRRNTKSLRDDPRQDLTRDRVAELERIFWSIVNSPRDKRRDSYRFPRVLIEHPTKPPIEAVLVSVLINQASLRKVFKLRGLGDPTGDTPADCARRLLERTNLVQLALYKTILDTHSSTMIACSPGEARRIAQKGLVASLPVPLGWTCLERAQAREGPSGRIEPPKDSCGVRKWGADVDAVVKPAPIAESPVDDDGIDPDNLPDDDDDLLEEDRKREAREVERERRAMALYEDKPKPEKSEKAPKRKIIFGD